METSILSEVLRYFQYTLNNLTINYSVILIGVSNMNIIRKKPIKLLLTLLLATTLLLTYQANATTTYDLTGTWTFNYELGETWPHTMMITTFNSDTGVFSGTGYYNPDPTTTWDLDGIVIGNAVSFHIEYTGSRAPYHVDATGIIDDSGLSMGGSATAPGQSATWSATKDSFTIETIVEGNGAISPVGPVIVAPGADQTFTITPDFGYHIADVIVDTVSVGVTNSYTFTNVQANHEIKAIFEINIAIIFSHASEDLEVFLDVLPGSPSCVPDLPEGFGAYYLVEIITGSFSGKAEVSIQYDEAQLPVGQDEQELRIFMSDPVDFNCDGTVNGKDIALIQKAIKSEYDAKYDINDDGVVDKADFRIVQMYATKGILVNPGKKGDSSQARLPWIDITTRVESNLNIIYGETEYFSIFRGR